MPVARRHAGGQLRLYKATAGTNSYDKREVAASTKGRPGSYDNKKRRPGLEGALADGFSDSLRGR